MTGAPQGAHSGSSHGGGSPTPGSPHDSRDLWPRDFGRDGVSGLVTVERAMRARDVSRPEDDDLSAAESVLAELLARVDGRRP
jgi:hypothetical protein